MGDRFIRNIDWIYKKMTSEYFCKLNLQFEFMDRIYEELNSAIWYESKYKQCRSDASAELRNMIQEKVPFNIHCCGFFKNEPGWTYPIHKDSVRQTAINILLVDQCDEFNVYFYSDNFKTRLLAPYVKDELLLINTKKFHSVSNASSDKIRYVMSIGCVEQTYDELKKKFENV